MQLQADAAEAQSAVDIKIAVIGTNTSEDTGSTQGL